MKKLILVGGTGEILEGLRERIFNSPSSVKTKYEIIVVDTWGGTDYLVELYKEVKTQCETCAHPDVCKYTAETSYDTTDCVYYRR